MLKTPRKKVSAVQRQGQGHSPTAPTARAGTNMPVDAPTPLVHIMRVKVKRKRQVKAPKSKRKSVPSGRGSPRWIIRRKDCDKGVKKTCIMHHLNHQANMLSGSKHSASSSSLEKGSQQYSRRSITWGCSELCHVMLCYAALCCAVPVHGLLHVPVFAMRQHDTLSHHIRVGGLGF